MTKLDAALTGVTRLGFDTSPFIYFVERNPAYVHLMREIFRRVDVGTLSGYSSMITLAEVLTQPLRFANIGLANTYRNFLTAGRNFELQPIDVPVAEKAADLRARYALKTPDALQVATALQTGCEAFLTNDLTFQRIVELRVLILDDLEL